uniref:Uncharacterized protein n=1 Tax=Romanomermis culicivorax TaxID=13658 RepID=A0A915ISH7_ROMCU
MYSENENIYASWQPCHTITVITKYDEAKSFPKETVLHTCLDTSIDSSARMKAKWVKNQNK